MERVRKTIHECAKGKLIYDGYNYEVFSIGVTDYDGIRENEMKLMATYYPNGYGYDSLSRRFYVGSNNADDIKNCVISHYKSLTGITEEIVID